MSPGRELLLGILDFPDLVSDVDSTVDLANHGVTSIDVVRLASAIEDRVGAELDDDQLLLLTTIDGIDAVLAGH